MPRNKKIEDILEAWYRLDHCPHSERAKAKTALDSLLDAAIGNQAFTRHEILDSLHGHYVEFRKSRAANEKLRIARAVPKH